MMIVLYPYLTGLVDGSFIVAALYYVFGVKSLKPISRFSLVFALAFLSCAMFPLLMHLGRPERNHNMMITPSPTSAMSGAGFIFTVAIVLIGLIVLLVYRPTLVKLRLKTKGIMKILYRVLTMDSTNLSPESLELDRKDYQISCGHRYPCSHSASRIRGVSVRRCKSESKLVNASHAGYFSVLRMCIGDLCPCFSLYRDQEDYESAGRCGLCPDLHQCPCRILHSRLFL